jgi:hypothetical protein
MRVSSFFALSFLALAACTVPARQADPEPAPISSEAPVIPNYTMSQAERDACTAANGFVDRRGRIQAEVCVTPYADAGKVCTDGDQCEGRCIAEGQAGTPPGETTEGICQRDDYLFGCYGIVEDGVIEAGLCVD